MNFNQLASGQKRVNHAHRLVQIGILISLLWKISFFIYADRVYETISIQIHSFRIFSDLQLLCVHVFSGRSSVRSSMSLQIARSKIMQFWAAIRLEPIMPAPRNL